MPTRRSGGWLKAATAELIVSTTIINPGGNIMAKQVFGTELRVIGPTGDPTYRFINRDEDKIQIINLKDSNQSILIEKQSLLVFAQVLKELGKEFTV